MDFDPSPGTGDHDEKVRLAARAIATAVSPTSGIADVQAELLGAITSALNGVAVDYRTLDPLSPEEFAALLDGSDLSFREKMVHCMVLGEIVLRPIPSAVAERVASYAQALSVDDEFVQIARQYSDGMYDVAWADLQRHGFELSEDTDPFTPASVDPELAERWLAFEQLPEGTLGRAVWTMYDERGFALPGLPGGAHRYLAQHDFVHVLADYGTNLRGELEVFSFIARADPDPNGFAWLATVIGLFETGYIESSGFFDRDVREHNIAAPGMAERVADAIRRGNLVCDCTGRNLFDVDYYALADRDVADVCAELGIPAKSSLALDHGSVGVFDLSGMSATQRRLVEARRGTEGT